jgi:hypothetical protein
MCESSRRAAVELRPEENRGALEDLVGPAQLADLPLELLHAGALLGREARSFTVVDLGLADPVAERFGPDPQLLRHSADGAVAPACSAAVSWTRRTARSFNSAG